MPTPTQLRAAPAALLMVAATSLLLATAFPGPAAGSPSPAAGSAWTSPLGTAGPPAVVRPFDPPAPDWGPGHRGVDLSTRPGATVYAAGTGVVTYSGLAAGVGVVTIDHGDLHTTYQPVTAAVGAGTRVAAGALIGYVASLGSHCSPQACLHWGLLTGASYLDPLSLLGASRRVRLLPIDLPATGSIPTTSAGHPETAGSAVHPGPSVMISAAAAAGAAAGSG